MEEKTGLLKIHKNLKCFFSNSNVFVREMAQCTQTRITTITIYLEKILFSDVICFILNFNHHAIFKLKNNWIFFLELFFFFFFSFGKMQTIVCFIFATIFGSIGVLSSTFHLCDCLMILNVNSHSAVRKYWYYCVVINSHQTCVIILRPIDNQKYHSASVHAKNTFFSYQITFKNYIRRYSSMYYSKIYVILL